MKTIYTDITSLIADKKSTYLTTDVVSSGITLSVQSIIGFSGTAQILLVGEIGEEKSEVIFGSNGTAPTGTTIYLQTGLTFDHPQDTRIYLIDWDELQLLYSATIGGAKSILTTMTIQPDMREDYLSDTTYSNGYYFTRFRNNKTIQVADYSDPIPYGDYADSTVSKIKERALDSCDSQIDQLITHDFLNTCLWQARREYHNSPGKRPFRRKYDVDLGNVSAGMYRLAVPSDLENPTSAENLYGIRIGTSENLNYYDKKKWDEDYQGIPHTTLDIAYAIGDKDLYCRDVRDLDDSGTVHIENDSIAYSAKGVSGGTLRISTAGSYSHIAESDVWQNETQDLPQRFTVFVDGNGTAAIYFNCPISTSYINQNIYGDYYRTLVPYNSEGDELDEPDYDIFVPYLAYRIKKKKNKGLVDKNDPDYNEWLQKKATSLNNEYIGVEITFYPDVPDTDIRQ